MKWLMFWIQQLQQPFIQNNKKVGRSILRHLKEAQRGEDEKEQRQQRSKKNEKAKTEKKVARRNGRQRRGEVGEGKRGRKRWGTIKRSTVSTVKGRTTSL